MPAHLLSRLAAVLAALGIAAGAFGAHGLKNYLTERNMLAVWQTAVFYHLIHALALWVLAGRVTHTPLTGWLWLAGLAGFSGSLYILAVVSVPWLGPVTPLGGLCFIAGWIAAAIKPPSEKSS